MGPCSLIGCDGPLLRWRIASLMLFAIATRSSVAMESALAPESLTSIVRNLTSTDPKTRSGAVEAAYTLMRDYYGPASDISSPNAFRRFSQRSEDSIAPLIELLDNSDEGVATTAADLLATVAIDNELVRAQLRRVAMDSKRSYVVRSTAAIAILYVTPDTRSAVAEVCGSPDTPIRPEFEASDFRTPLSEDAQNLRMGDFARVVTLVGHHLRASGHTCIEVPVLVELATTKEHDLDTRIMATMILGELEEEAASAQAALITLLKDEDSLVSWSAALSIIRVDKNANTQTIRMLAERAGVKDEKREEYIARLNQM